MNIKELLTPYKELLTLNIRYKDNPNRSFFHDENNDITTTIGIYDSYEEACKAGNDILENVFEKRFKLNSHYNSPMRFGKIGFIGNLRLITNLGYIQTPFDFYLKIEKLYGGDVSQIVDEIANARERYKNYIKRKENELL